MNVSGKHTSIPETCRRCGIPLTEGIAMDQTWVRGIPDFLGEPDNTQNLVQTMHAGGPGKLIHCLKCPNCGYSVTA